MKRRIWIAAAIIFAAGLAYILLSHPKPPKADLYPEQQPTKASNPPLTPKREPAQVAQTTTQAFPSSAQSPIAEAQERQVRAEILRRALENRNVPIEIYGKVIDQDSNALAGVTINGRVRHWDPSSFGGSIPVAAETDREGRFHLHGATGDAVDIEAISKAGYELPGPRGASALGRRSRRRQSAPIRSTINHPQSKIQNPKSNLSLCASSAPGISPPSPGQG